jgi:hypothetical protein
LTSSPDRQIVLLLGHRHGPHVGLQLPGLELVSKFKKNDIFTEIFNKNKSEKEFDKLTFGNIEVV